MARFTRTIPPPQVQRDIHSCVRNDFEQCCAYCCLHERHAGGEENFEIDHFRPKSLFPHLVNDFYNLYYSCHACNSTKKKGAKWPSDVLIAKGISFVDLCKDDFAQHY